MSVRIITGDCREVMATMEPESVDAIVTDPPAGISFMGKSWDRDKGGRDAWVSWLADVMSEAYRLAKPGAHAIVWALPRTSGWTHRALEDAGWEVRDCLLHLFGSGFPKSHNLDGDWEGWGTALKPAAEFWYMARKPFSGTVAANVTRYGTGAINVDGCRIGTDGGTRGSEFVPNSTPIYGKGFGGKVTIEQISAGRWPANVLLGCACDGETHDPDCAAALLDAQSGETKSTDTSNPEPSSALNGYGPGDRDGWGGAWHKRGVGHNDTGGASRFFYTSKASRAERNKGLDGMPEEYGHRENGFSDKLSNTKIPRANHHPTVKPLDLMQWLVRLVTPRGGIVLDPFCGSGTTLIAADREGFDAIGIEQDAEYAEIARRRCIGDAPMFANVAAD